MSDWDDLDLEPSEDRRDAPTEPLPISNESDKSSPLWWPLLAAGALALTTGLTLFWLFSSDGPVTVPQPSAFEEPSAPHAPELASPVEEETAPEEPEIVLPALNDSDTFVRDLLGRLSRHPGMATFLMTEGIARKVVAAVVNISQGENPARHFPYLAPEEDFDVERRGTALFVDPRSYRRYDVLVSGFAAADVAGLAQAYRTSKPLLDEAFAELGYQDQRFEDHLAKAIAVLSRTPVVDGRIELYGESVNYTFADRRLESLSVAQKQLLRAGPRNVETVQSKLRELAAALELPAES